MKFLVLLAIVSSVLAATNVKFSIDIGNMGGDVPPHPSDKPIPTGTDGKPLSPLGTQFKARMEAARAAADNPKPHWSDDYTSVCSTTTQLSFEIYPIEHLDEPEKMDAGIRWAAQDLDTFFDGVPYPGGFSASETAFHILRIDFVDLNVKLRHWLEDSYNANQKSIYVKDSIAFFAPAVVLELLPLFVGEKGECGVVFEDLRRYGKDVGGERVSGGVMGKTQIGNSVMVQLKLEKLVKQGEEKKPAGKDEL